MHDGHANSDAFAALRLPHFVAGMEAERVEYGVIDTHGGVALRIGGGFGAVGEEGPSETPDATPGGLLLGPLLAVPTGLQLGEAALEPVAR